MICIVKFFKKFKIEKYNVDTIRIGNTGRKDRSARFEYHFYVMEGEKDILHLDVPADSYESAKCGLKGSMRVKKLIKEKYKPPKR